MPRRPLTEVLTDAAAFARAHGIDNPIAPEDFAVQRSAPGYQHATYLDAYVESDGVMSLVSVFVDPDGRETFAVGEVVWVHDQADENRDLCDYCEVIETSDFVDVPLPGDGTPPPAPEIPPYACRDEHGNIRRARDGLFIAGPGATTATLRARIAAYDGNDTAYAHSMRRLCTAALELVEAEAAEAVTTDA
ncbi:hypothetical protein [Nocardia wallacei]|uniref:hypothetical protein n=1 Tax=Nocardia wallacei TaxID=480035 RepID=UPI0024589626|nr:hypothetical protein [Nocardia wallacei]